MINHRLHGLTQRTKPEESQTEIPRSTRNDNSVFIRDKSVVVFIISFYNMFELNPLGKILIFFGVILILIGGAILLAGKVPWIGRLPGDIFIQKKNFTFYFPLATSIIISIILTLIFSILGRR